MGSAGHGPPQGCWGPPRAAGEAAGSGPGLSPLPALTHMCTHTTHRHLHGPAQPVSLELGIVPALGAAVWGATRVCRASCVLAHLCVCLGHAQGRALVALARLCRASHALGHV